MSKRPLNPQNIPRSDKTRVVELGGYRIETTVIGTLVWSKGKRIEEKK